MAKRVYSSRLMLYLLLNLSSVSLKSGDKELILVHIVSTNCSDRPREWII